MNTLNKYIAVQFLTTFFMALIVLSFVMSIGLLFTAIDYIARGMSVEFIMSFIWSGIPFTLSYSIPISLLICSLLVFGRLSSDSEIMAMRACGVTLLDIMRMPLLISILLSIFCLYLNNNAAPNSNFARHKAKNSIGVNEIYSMIEPGKTIESDDLEENVSFHVEGKKGNRLEEVTIIQRLSENSAKFTRRKLHAKHAIITAKDNNNILHIKLFDVTISSPSANNSGDMTPEKMTSVVAKELPFVIKAKKKQKKIERRYKDKPSWQLAAELKLNDLYPIEEDNSIPDDEKKNILKNLARSKAEIYSRIVLALSCFSFVMIGIPLGIKQHRRESSIGLVLSLAIAGGFYLFALLAQEMAKGRNEYAHLFVMIPLLVCVGLGTYLIKKNN